jgi:hypothetical protein
MTAEEFVDQCRKEVLEKTREEFKKQFNERLVHKTNCFNNMFAWRKDDDTDTA